jgi:hypothetical protein
MAFHFVQRWLFHNNHRVMVAWQVLFDKQKGTLKK